MNEILKQNSINLPQINKEQLIRYLELTGIGKDITEQEKGMFLEIAILNGLNPFNREIYITAYGKGEKRQLSILTGFEVYIRRAEESGLLDGWNVETSGNIQQGTLKAKITIFRKDFSKPFTHEVEYSEYVQYKDEWVNGQKTGRREPNKFWAEKPITMIKKVAISQGFRMCFNKILGGMPYTQDEMPQQQIQDVSHEVISEPVKIGKVPEPKKISEAGFQKGLELLKTNFEKAVATFNIYILSDEQKSKLDEAVFEMCKGKKVDEQYELLKNYTLPESYINRLVDFASKEVLTNGEKNEMEAQNVN